MLDIASLELRLSRSENLPILSQVANHVLERADDPTVTAAELESIISVDPGIAAKLLKVANSALYGASSDGLTLMRAIHVLGLATVKRMVLTVSFQQMIADELHDGQAFDKVEYWRHCYATAVASRELARKRCAHLAEELFAASIMHDIGYIVLEKFAFPVCQAAFRVAIAQNVPVEQVERRILGWDHTDAGAALARRWRMTPLVECAIQHHHTPAKDDRHYETTCIISIANTLARQNGFATGVVLESEEFDGNAYLEVGPSDEELETISAIMADEVVAAQQAFGIDSEPIGNDEEPRSQCA